ncbi:MAG: hypothetical protein HQK89_14900, partial [Nitrospirae bacterium]|nr:hypothetical protein [Nitrospirota bacterium]
IYGQAIKWADTETVFREAGRLMSWLDDKHISASFVRNLLYYSIMYNKYIKEEKTDYLRFIPLMTYDIVRNLPPVDHKVERKRLVRLWADKLKDIDDENTILNYLTTIASYVLMGKSNE